MRPQWKTLRSLVAVATLTVATLGVTAGSAFAIAGPGGDPGGGRGSGGTGPGGGSGGGGTPPPDNIVSFSGNSYLGAGHGQTASGMLDRTTATLYVATQTTAGWCLVGWHGASQVIIDDSAGHMIWASGELGPTGVDGGCGTTNQVNVSYPAIVVPAAVASHAAEIDVFNFWDPQWTALNKVVGAVGSAAKTVWTFCTSNPNACSAVGGALFSAILAA